MRGNTGKTQQPARLTLASPVKLPHILPEKPCHSSTWNQDTWLAWKHVNNIYGSAFLLSDSKPWALQPSTFLHFSHLSFEPAGQWTEDIPAVLTAPMSGCQGWAADVFLASCCHSRGSPTLGRVSYWLKRPCHKGFHFTSAVSQAEGVVERRET